MAVMSGSARMQFLPTLSLAVTRPRELRRTDNREGVSGVCRGGGLDGGENWREVYDDKSHKILQQYTRDWLTHT